MATASATDKAMRRYAAAVISRDQFASVFDELARGKADFTFKFIAQLEPGEPYFSAFGHAAEAGFLAPLLESLQHAGVFDLAKLAGGTHANATVSPHLEAITQPTMGFPNVEMEIAGKLTASRRLCCITVLDAPGGAPVKSGTGFLVGPQTVLTSYHVIDDLLDQQGMPKANSNQRLRVAFDELNGLGAAAPASVHPQWLAGHSTLHQLDTDIVLDWDDPPEIDFDKHFDCALVRLKDTVGRERGYYRLDPNRMPVVDGAGSRVGLLQHPAGQPLSSTAGAGLRLWPKTHKTRFHHSANSAPGSSGGLLVDNEFKPIGLHQCSYRDKKKVLFNGAITTAAIAKLNLPMDVVIGFEPIAKLGNGEPVIGREDFQRSVLDAEQGHLKILTVAGATKMGRSFTTSILRQMLGNAQHHIVELSASQLQVTARATAHTMLGALTKDDSMVPTLPDTAQAETAQAGWILAELFPAFSQELPKLAGHRTVWLVIDDVDIYPIANTSTRVFLEALYAGIAGVPNLRIVLIGFQGAVPGAPSPMVQGELLREFNLIELTQYIERESTAHGITRSRIEAQGMAQRLLDLETQLGKLSKAQFANLAAADARRKNVQP